MAPKCSDDCPTRRSRLFCSVEESSLREEENSPTVRNHAQHVQAAAMSRRRSGRHRLFSTSPTKRPEISAELLPCLDCLEDKMDILPFSLQTSPLQAHKRTTCNKRKAIPQGVLARVSRAGTYHAPTRGLRPFPAQARSLGAATSYLKQTMKGWLKLYSKDSSKEK